MAFHLQIKPVRTTSALRGAANPDDLADQGYRVEDGYVVVETQTEADELLNRHSNLELELGRGAERSGDIERAQVSVDGVDRDDEFDAEAWLDQHYTDRADAVRAGEVDADLDKIADIETSETVRDAVAERLSELES